MRDSRLRVLVAYSMAATHVQTTYDYLSAFAAYLDAEVEYVHVTHNAILSVDLDRYDVVINSYCARHCFENYVTASFTDALRCYRGVKILIVQDEYNHTNRVKAAIRELGFDVVFTCVPQADREYVYPDAEFPGVRFETVLTGYVPDHLLRRPREPLPLAQRPIVVGYRGRLLPSYYGRLGFDKYEIGRRFRELCAARNVPHDIELGEEKRIYGPAWFDFIGSCRAMLGTESGSNVFDFDGSLERKHSEITAMRGAPPSFEEFAPHIGDRETRISMGQVSPRIFECAIMRTPMILFRGRYSDVIEPETHYIPLEKDFSNADEVFRRLDDIPALEAMAQRAYDDLVGAGIFGYRSFMRRVEDIIAEAVARKRSADFGPVSVRPAGTVPATADTSRPWLEQTSRWPGTAALWEFRHAEQDAWHTLFCKVIGDNGEATFAEVVNAVPDERKMSAGALQFRSQIETLASQARERCDALAALAGQREPLAVPVDASVAATTEQLHEISAVIKLLTARFALADQIARSQTILRDHTESCAHVERDLAAIAPVSPDAEAIAKLRRLVTDFRDQIAVAEGEWQSLEALAAGPLDTAEAKVEEQTTFFRQRFVQVAHTGDRLAGRCAMLLVEHRTIMSRAAAELFVEHREELRRAAATAETLIGENLQSCSYIEADLDAIPAYFPDRERISRLRQELDGFKSDVAGFAAFISSLEAELAGDFAPAPGILPVSEVERLAGRCRDRLEDLYDRQQQVSNRREGLLDDYRALMELVGSQPAPGIIRRLICEIREMRNTRRLPGLWRLRRIWCELALGLRVRGVWRLKQMWSELRLGIRVRGWWRLQSAWRELSLRWQLHFGLPLTVPGLLRLAWRCLVALSPLSSSKLGLFLIRAAMLRRPAAGQPAPAVAGGRPRLLMICAHEPTMDPRIGWEAEGACRQFDLTVLGFNREDGSEPPEADCGGYRIVRLPRVDLPPSRYFRHLRELVPLSLRLAGAVVGVILYPVAAALEVAARLVAAGVRFALWTGRRLRLVRRPGRGSRRFWNPERVHFVLGNLRMQFAPAAELFCAHIAALPVKPDVIHCNDLDTLLVGVVAKRRFGCGLVYDAHEFWPVVDSLCTWIDTTFFSLLERFLIRQADAVVSVNPLLAEAMREAYRLPRVHSVPNVEPWRDRRPPLRRPSPMAELAAGRVKFLFQGRFTKARGIEEIVNAWADVDVEKAALFLRGPDNPWRQEAIALAGRLGLLGRSVYFLDAVSEAELVTAAAEADVGIVPYLPLAINERLACPNKLSQYLHAGLAVLTNNLPYVRSVVEEAGAGLWYDSADLATLAAAANRIAGDRELLQSCRRNALAFAQANYNWQRHGQAFLDLYAAAARRQRPGATDTGPAHAAELAAAP